MKQSKIPLLCFLLRFAAIAVLAQGSPAFLQQRGIFPAGTANPSLMEEAKGMLVHGWVPRFEIGLYCQVFVRRMRLQGAAL